MSGKTLTVIAANDEARTFWIKNEREDDKKCDCVT